jgi:gentisate 1,2-dioxygenase
MASTVAGGDVMAAIRCQFHRLRAGADSATRREGGSTIFQVLQNRALRRADHGKAELCPRAGRSCTTVNG